LLQFGIVNRWGHKLHGEGSFAAGRPPALSAALFSFDMSGMVQISAART
jgi:hypothetical protein